MLVNQKIGWHQLALHLVKVIESHREINWNNDNNVNLQLVPTPPNLK